MNIRVRSISHEIILHSHLSRNPLDSKVKSYCKTTHIEAAITSHLFEGKMHCWPKPPHVRNPVYKASHISCTSNFQLLPAASNCFKKIHMSSRRIVGYVQVSRDTAHPKVQAKLILNLQTCFQYGFAVDTAGLTSDERITNSIQCQKIGLPNRKVVFQPSICRGYVSFTECTGKHFQLGLAKRLHTPLECTGKHFQLGLSIRFHLHLECTLPETNVAPENRPPQ